MSLHQIRFGPFSIEDEPLRLRRGADLIQLRPKSLEVLKYLAERPGSSCEQGGTVKASLGRPGGK